MYEPKAKDLITTNGKHILVYEYLDFPHTIMLANEIVIGINPDADEICFMIPDKNNVYIDVTDIFTRKPTLGEIEMYIKTHNLFSTEKITGGKVFDKEILREKYHELKLNYFNR